MQLLPINQTSYARENRTDGLLGMFVWIIFIAVFLLGIAPSLGLATHAFSEGIAIGFAVGLSTDLLSAYAGKNAGAFHIRMRTALGGWGLAARLLVVIGIALAASRLETLNDWIVRGIGFTGFLAAFGFMTRIQMRTIDLRENGVVFQRRFYWPWGEVNKISWDRADTGKLVLGRGWRRIVAVVPSYQRDALDALLAEKLGKAAARLEKRARAATAETAPPARAGSLE
jgi:hypothetical protein